MHLLSVPRLIRHESAEMYWRLADCGVPAEHLVYARASHSAFVTAWRPLPPRSPPGAPSALPGRTPTSQPLSGSSANGAPESAPAVIGEPAALGSEAVLGSAAAPRRGAALGSVAALGSPAACGPSPVEGAEGAHARVLHFSGNTAQPAASEPVVSTQECAVSCGMGSLHDRRGRDVSDLPGFAQDLVAILTKRVHVAQRPCGGT